MHIKPRQSSQGQPKHSPGSTPAAVQGRQKEGKANTSPLLATTLPSPESTYELCSLGHGSCMAWTPQRHHLQSIATILVWLCSFRGPLTIGFWRSQRLLKERPVPISLRQLGHQALHYFPPCMTGPCLPCGYHRLIPRAGKLPQGGLWPETALGQGQETCGL